MFKEFIKKFEKLDVYRDEACYSNGKGNYAYSMIVQISDSEGHLYYRQENYIDSTDYNSRFEFENALVELGLEWYQKSHASGQIKRKKLGKTIKVYELSFDENLKKYLESLVD